MSIVCFFGVGKSPALIIHGPYSRKSAGEDWLYQPTAKKCVSSSQLDLNAQHHTETQPWLGISNKDHPKYHRSMSRCFYTGGSRGHQWALRKSTRNQSQVSKFWVEHFKILFHNAKYWQVAAYCKMFINAQTEDHSSLKKYTYRKKSKWTVFLLTTSCHKQILSFYPNNKVGFCLWWSLHACPWIQLITGSKCHSRSWMCLKPGPATHNFHRLQIISVLTPSKTN